MLAVSTLFSACAAPGLKPYTTCNADNAPATDPSGLRGAPLSPELLVPDVDTGVAWYRDVMGFTVDRNDAPAQSCFAGLRLGTDVVLLSHVAGRETGPDNRIELRFMVDDVDAIYARAKANGATLVRDIRDADYGLREFVVRDPYGFRLRFATPLR